MNILIYVCSVFINRRNALYEEGLKEICLYIEYKVI
jgi:hypothetical protein